MRLLQKKSALIEQKNQDKRIEWLFRGKNLANEILFNVTHASDIRTDNARTLESFPFNWK